MIRYLRSKPALRRKTIWFSILVIAFMLSVAILAPWISPHDPYDWEISHSNLPPMWVKNTPRPGVADYPLGTDRYGRDNLSRMIYGTRTAMFLALIAVPLAALIGTLIGLVAGYVGSQTDHYFMLFSDMIQSLPGIMFVVIIILIFRGILSPSWFDGLIALVISFAAISWVSLARLVRINVMMVKPQLFVEAAVSVGASPWRILRRHIFPNIRHVVLVWIINTIPAVILLEAVLGYIGVGVTSAIDGSEFSAVSWGGMFFAGRSMMSSNLTMLLVPSVCILLISMSFIFLGDYLNERGHAR